MVEPSSLGDDSVIYTSAIDIMKGRCRSHTDRIYSGEVLEAGEQRAWYWVCPDCTESGTDTFDLHFTPDTDAKAYWGVMRSINPRCWVPQAFQ